MSAASESARRQGGRPFPVIGSFRHPVGRPHRRRRPRFAIRSMFDTRRHSRHSPTHWTAHLLVVRRNLRAD